MSRCDLFIAEDQVAPALAIWRFTFVTYNFHQDTIEAFGLCHSKCIFTCHWIISHENLSKNHLVVYDCKATGYRDAADVLWDKVVATNFDQSWLVGAKFAETFPFIVPVPSVRQVFNSVPGFKQRNSELLLRLLSASVVKWSQLVDRGLTKFSQQAVVNPKWKNQLLSEFWVLRYQLHWLGKII